MADLPDRLEIEGSPFRLAYSQLDPLKPTGIEVRPELKARWLTEESVE